MMDGSRMVLGGAGMLGFTGTGLAAANFAWTPSFQGAFIVVTLVSLALFLLGVTAEPSQPLRSPSPPPRKPKS